MPDNTFPGLPAPPKFPAIFRELSVARSTKECGQQAAKTLSDLRRDRRLRVPEDNPRLGYTRDTTAYVDCI